MKIEIDTPTWSELSVKLAERDIDLQFTEPWRPETGNESYTEEAQDAFNQAIDEVDEILNQFFVKTET